MRASRLEFVRGANTGSNAVKVFAVDGQTGKLSGPVSGAPVPAPSSVAFVAGGG